MKKALNKTEKGCAAAKRAAAVFALLLVLFTASCRPASTDAAWQKTEEGAFAAPASAKVWSAPQSEAANEAPKRTSCPRKVYLTFDDGPNKATPAVLDILKKYNVKATFFTVGSCIRANPGTARRIAEEGHLIACHTDSHEFGVIYSSPKAFVDDVRKWRKTVTEYVGAEKGAFVFRFPGGSVGREMGGRKGREAYVKAMNEAGYIAVDWNLGLNDKWLAGNTKRLPLSDYLWSSYIETWRIYGDKDPLILLIHDTEPESVKLLPRVIEDLKSRGLEFGLCDELKANYLM